MCLHDEGLRYHKTFHNTCRIITVLRYYKYNFLWQCLEEWCRYNDIDFSYLSKARKNVLKSLNINISKTDEFNCILTTDTVSQQNA